MSAMERENGFAQWKRQCLNKLDLSKKGSIDEEICNIVSFLNQTDYYFTTSSCSGRIILIDAVSDAAEVQKQNCSWLFVTHKKCSKEDVLTGLEKSIEDAVFKFEPCVLHIQCRRMEDAQLLHSVAISSGFRNSGITVGKKGKIIMAVRSTHCLEVPLSRKGQVLISDEYIDFLVGIANGKMDENLKRIERFFQCLTSALKPEQVETQKQNAATDTKPVYRRRRKRLQECDGSECGVKNPSASDQEDHEEPDLTLFS